MPHIDEGTLPVASAWRPSVPHSATRPTITHQRPLTGQLVELTAVFNLDKTNIHCVRRQVIKRPSQYGRFGICNVERTDASAAAFSVNGCRNDNWGCGAKSHFADYTPNLGLLYLRHRPRRMETPSPQMAGAIVLLGLIYEGEFQGHGRSLRYMDWSI
ncbi:hypothetical protein VE02_08996 [Pseudogymnoascus sp. 03VT05]|nr:hypothetical protein VE02_08996 [Pseudogymnoascus sp. 03VT05]